MGTDTLRRRNNFTDVEVDSKSQDSEAGATQTITLAAVARKSYYIKAFELVAYGAAIGADITCTINAGATVKWKTIIGQGATRGERVGLVFTDPIQCPIDTAITVVVGAGGAGVITTANISYALSS